jgi:excisionase family DNA binding protein
LQPPMTVRELSDYLRLDRMTIYKMLKEGSIPASRIGHQWRFFQDDIDEWIRSLRTGPKTRLLVVTCDASMASMFQAGLSDDSYVPTITSNSDEAVTLATSDQIDLVLLDLTSSALECFRGIQDSGHTIPVVIFVGDNNGDLVQRAMEVGTFTLVKKPQTADELQSILASLPSVRPTGA